MMCSYTIRSINGGDEQFLWETLYLSIHVPVGHRPISREVLRHPSISRYIDGWGRAGDMGFIAENADGLPIGSITLRLFPESDRGYGYVDAATPELGMAMLPEYRGQGIGTKLMAAVVAEAKSRGIPAISLSVDERNPAMHLYLRAGFSEVSRHGDSITMKIEL